MIASRRTASAFVRKLAIQTTKSTGQRTGPTVARIAGANGASYYTGSNSFPQIVAGQPDQRRTFSNQMTAMFSSDDKAAPQEITPESLVEYVGGDSPVGTSVGDAMYALYTADAVCFDVDSTVINEEGIDVLAEFLGKGEAVAELTASAMEGGMKFDEALEARLDLLKPSRKQILECLEATPLELTPGIRELVETLHSKKVEVFLVSGGFRIMIEPVADSLEIPHETNLFANTIHFQDGDEGEYQSWCSEEPTSQDMGKPKALGVIQSKNPHLKNLVMVGDGATDAQAKPPAEAFIGFGGVVSREAVRERADWFVTSFEDMSKIVELRE